MKRLILLCTTLLALLFFGCKDECKDVVCNNGDCDSGVCICDVGYEGLNCDEELRTKHLGVYSGNFLPCLPNLLVTTLGIDPSATDDFEVNIVATPDDNIVNIVLDSPTGLIMPLEVDVTASSFTIPEQSNELSIQSIPLNISLSGVGMIVDENNIELDLVVGFDLTLLPFPIPLPNESCLVNLTK